MYEYTAADIQISSLREHIRKRPGMYFGDAQGGSGVLHLLLAVLADAIDQAMHGRHARVDIRVDADDTVTITDDGPGIPAARLTDLLARPLNRLHDAHRPPIGLTRDGDGLAICNAASTSFEVETVHAGTRTHARASDGLLETPLALSTTDLPSGTRVRFHPDPDIFHHARVPRLALTSRLEDLATLLPTLTLSWSFTGTSAAVPGLVGRVLTEVPDPLGGVAHHTGDIHFEDQPVHVDLAFAWPAHRPRTKPHIRSFTNLQPARPGQHLAGLRSAIHTFVPRHLRRTALEGLVADIAVLFPDPNHGRQTMLRLATPSIRRAVNQAATLALHTWAAAHPDAAAKLRTRP